MTINIAELANSHIRDLQPYQPGKPIEETQREYGLTQVIKLASNENPLGPSAHAIAAAHATLAHAHLYPDANGYQFKCALAQHLGVAREQLTLGNGSDNVLALIAQAFLNPEQVVLIPEYGFATFAIITHAMRGIPRMVPAQHYGLDPQAMARAVDQHTKLIFIANPNNPTGTCFDHATLATLLSQIPAHVLVVIDEAYHEYVQNADYPNSLALQKIYPNLVITRTFSKLYGLAGLRIGYGISSPEIADYLNRVRLPFNVSTPALAAATAALADTDHVQRTLLCNTIGMQYMQHELQQLSLDYIPSATNFITVDVKTNAQVIYHAMLAQGVIVRPLLPYRMPQHLRISIGTATENAHCLQALKHSLQQARIL